MDDSTFEMYLNTIADMITFDGVSEFSGDYEAVKDEIERNYGLEMAERIEAEAMAEVERTAKPIRHIVAEMPVRRRAVVVTLS